MITDWSEQHEALLPINHKNYNFWWKKNSQVMKVRYNFDLNYNFECDWLIEQSNINLASELVDKRSFESNYNQGIVIFMIRFIGSFSSTFICRLISASKEN